MGYSLDEDVRKGAASGGLVSSMLIDQLESGKITGAITCKTEVSDGELKFLTVLCKTKEEIVDCQTSIYSDFNHLKGIIRILEEEDGVFGIVALPCQWNALNNFIKQRPDLMKKIGLRIGLWCGHTSDRSLIYDFLRVNKGEMKNVDRFYYRRGLWRGETEVIFKSGDVMKLPFQKGYGLLQNLYIDSKKRCFSCLDHFAENADISFGDAWIREMKSRRTKYSLSVIFTENGVNAMSGLLNNDRVYLEEISPKLIVKSQKRSIVWHTYTNAARHKIGKLFGINIPKTFDVNARWNDYIAAVLIFFLYKI